VEFHWYSAEEGGLLGSQAVVKHYKANAKKVMAMSQVSVRTLESFIG
jgi:leucyl aminopeptidase